MIAPDTAMIGRFGQRRRSDRRIEARCFDRLLPGATAFNRHHFDFQHKLDGCAHGLIIVYHQKCVPLSISTLFDLISRDEPLEARIRVQCLAQHACELRFAIWRAGEHPLAAVRGTRRAFSV